MRLTPAQIGMLSLLGEHLPFCMPDDSGMASRIREGREDLIEIAGIDFEYDLKAWHDHLKVTNAGGYRWSNIHLGMPRQIAQAMSNPEWLAAVAELRGRPPE